MDWNLGYSAAYYGMFVDRATWRDIERFEITEGSISNSDEELRSSASLSCGSYPMGVERWIRIYLDATQGEETVHVPLFTGLASSPGETIEGSRITPKVDCYSVLKPAQDVLLERGWYAQAGISGARIIRDLLRVSPAPVEEAENAPALQEAVIAEDGESNLTMIDKILTAMNWRLRILGDGTIRICPKASEPVARYDALDHDAVEPSIEVDRDWYDCPNVFRAVSNDLSAVARDDSDRSALSTVNRGREIWMEETNCDLNDGETIAEYALRRLKEEQQSAETGKYSRRYNPDVAVSDIVTLHYPEQGLDGNYLVQSQSIEVAYGARTAEEVLKV